MATNNTYRAEMNYQEPITAPIIEVYFNGGYYALERSYLTGGYGSSILEEDASFTSGVPFFITRKGATNYVYVNSNIGTSEFDIVIETPDAQVSDCFIEAVRTALITLDIAGK